MRRESLPWFPLAAGFPLLMVLGILWLAGLGLVFQTLADAVSVFTGDLDASMLYQRTALSWNMGVDEVRLVLLVPVHLISFVAGWPLLRRVFIAIRWITTTISRWFEGWTRTQAVLATCAWAITLTAGTALVVQPGLVPLDASAPSWKARAANLLDGTASLETWSMAVGLHRRLTGAPIPGAYSVQANQLSAHGLDDPLMARWDDLLSRHTNSDVHFAQTKSFMWVESAGRQYAVSQTGCLGLFQFCVSTAKRRPFRRIFGAGNVSACSCSGKPCVVARALRDALESDRAALERGSTAFPCDATDARFDPERAIPAGAAFVTELADDVKSNLLLMYIGYNSGPAVAKKLHRVTGKRADVTIEDLRPHLSTVLKRWYGDRATPRANGLLDVHLPKLQAAYEHYLTQRKQPR